MLSSSPPGAGDPGPVPEEPGLAGCQLGELPVCDPGGIQASVGVADPAHQVGVDERQDAGELGAVEPPVVVHPPGHDRVGRCRSPSRSPSTASGRPRPHPAPSGPGGSRRNRGGTPVPPALPDTWPLPSGRLGRRPSGCPTCAPHRRAVSESPPPVPEPENRSPTTSDSTPCTDCSSGRSRSRRCSAHPPPAHPDWFSPSPRHPRRPASRYRTACLTILALPFPVPPPPMAVWLTDNSKSADDPAPSLRTHYRHFTATTSRSAGAHRNRG